MSSPPHAGPDVVVVGNVGIDTNVFAGAVDLSEPIAEGQFTNNVDYLGQAGGYSARGFVKAGARTAFIGHVGADPFGVWIREELTADGIDLRGLGIDPTGTARSVNLLGKDGARVNFYDGRGHMSVSVEPELAAGIFAGAKLAMFHLPDWARHLLPVAREAGCVIAVDLQDIHELDDPYRADFIAAADIIFLSSAHHPDPLPMLKALVSASHGGFVVSGRGPDGVSVATADGVQHYPPPALDLPLVDTNGAGDALAVGFLTARVLQGRSIEDAVLRGQVGARWNCTQRASSSNLITAATLDELLSALPA